MSKVIKIKKGFAVYCECGALHEITKETPESELQISSIYKRKKEHGTQERKQEPKQPEQQKQPEPKPNTTGTDESYFF